MEGDAMSLGGRSRLRQDSAAVSSENRSLLRAIVAISSTALIGQVVSVAAAPVLSRVYDPSAYGAFSVFMAIVGSVSTLSMLRYDVAVPLPRSVRSARAIAVLCGALLTATTLATLIVWGEFGTLVADCLNVPSLAERTGLIGGGVFAAGLSALAVAWAMRERDYAVIAHAQLVQGIVGTLTSLALGFAGMVSTGLLAGNIVFQVSGVMTIVAERRSAAGRAWGSRPDIRRILAMARRYRKFPTYNTGHQFLSLISQNAPAVMFAGFFGGTTAGLYAMALRICVLPSSIVSSSMGRVYFGEAAALRTDTPRLSDVTERLVGWLIVIGMPVFGALAAFAPVVFAAVLGSEWREAGVMSQVLAPWLGIAFVSGPLSILPLVFERQRGAAAYGVADMVLRLGALSLGGVTRNHITAAALLSSAGAVSCAFMLAWGLRLAKVKMGGLVSACARCCTPSAAILMVGAWAARGPLAEYGLGVAFICSAVAIASAVLVHRHGPQFARNSG